jgi:hypothetical protein
MNWNDFMTYWTNIDVVHIYNDKNCKLKLKKGKKNKKIKKKVKKNQNYGIV